LFHLEGILTSSLLLQMTCVRLLQILPVVFEIIYPSFGKKPGDSRMMVESLYNFSWLNDLMDWGKSSLKVLIVYWKQTVTILLSFLKDSFGNTATMIISAIENLISCGKLSYFVIIAIIIYIILFICIALSGHH
jgi:hypothetical protein